MELLRNSKIEGIDDSNRQSSVAINFKLGKKEKVWVAFLSVEDVKLFTFSKKEGPYSTPHYRYPPLYRFHYWAAYTASNDFRDALGQPRIESHHRDRRGFVRSRSGREAAATPQPGGNFGIGSGLPERASGGTSRPAAARQFDS